MSKKSYIIPRFEIVNVETKGMLALSTGFGEATGPARSSELDFILFDDDSPQDLRIDL